MRSLDLSNSVSVQSKLNSEEAKLNVLKKAKNLRDKKEGGMDKVLIYPD